MIRPYTRLKVADNSGAKKVMCFNILKLGKKHFARLGDIIVASVKVALPNSQVKKKEVIQAVIVRQKFPFQRIDGTVIKFDDNAVVLINKDGTPRGTRVLGPIAREVKERFPKIASLASEII